MSSAAFQRITVPIFREFKKNGRKIAMLTAYDYLTAGLLDQAGIEGILVGDSLSMVVQGHDTTLPVTLEEMIYHGKLVCRGVKQALVVVDMPFPTYHLGKYKAVESAGRILKETGCQGVKLEGGTDQADVIEALVTAGIPVMAHCGLRPQSVLMLGGYKVQREEERIMADAKAAENAGAFAIVLECIPEELAKKITQAISIPTIGIGAGAGCDGQVLVTPDMLGMTPGPHPRFVKHYADLKGTILQAASQYRADVQAGTFPSRDQSYR